MSIVSFLHHTLHLGALLGVAAHRLPPPERNRRPQQRDAGLEAALSPPMLSSGHIVLNVFQRRQP